MGRFRNSIPFISTTLSSLHSHPSLPVINHFPVALLDTGARDSGIRPFNSATAANPPLPADEVDWDRRPAFPIVRRPPSVPRGRGGTARRRRRRRRRVMMAVAVVIVTTVMLPSGATLSRQRTPR